MLYDRVFFEFFSFEYLLAFLKRHDRISAIQKESDRRKECNIRSIKKCKEQYIERKGEEIVTFWLCDLRKFISCMDDPGYGLLCKTS